MSSTSDERLQELASETDWQDEAKHRKKKVSAFFEMCPKKRHPAPLPPPGRGRRGKGARRGGTKGAGDGEDGKNSDDSTPPEAVNIKSFDFNKSPKAKGPFWWLIMTKCQPERGEQRFYWKGDNLVHAKTGLCVSIYPQSNLGKKIIIPTDAIRDLLLRGYATLEGCSDLTALTIPADNPTHLKTAYNPTVTYQKLYIDAYHDTWTGTVTETIPATCLGWMKAKKGTDENGVKVAILSDCVASSSDEQGARYGTFNTDQQRWHVGSGIISLNDWAITCSDGYALNSFKFEAGKVSYTCAAMGAVGACSSIQSPEVDTLKTDLTQLPKLHLDCGHGALQKIHPELASGAGTIKYSYTCCQLTEPATILLTGTTITEKLPEFSGVYCSEESRDVSGRLGYKQRSWFQEQNNSSRKQHNLTFDHLKGSWCLSGSDCTTSDVPVPTDDPGLGTKVWQALEVTDFNYNPVPRGTAKKVRAFPKLLQFKAVQPHYARECQDDVTPSQSGFDRDQMNKVMAELPMQNPCSLVGGNAKGGMPSYKPAKSAFGDAADAQYGLTYRDVWDCRAREKSRGGDMWKYKHGNAIASLVAKAIKGYKGLICAAFPSVGTWAGFGAGVEAGEDAAKLCAQGVDNVITTVEVIQDSVGLVKDAQFSSNNGGDCDPLRSGLSRIFCDLHCIRDSVRAGDSAILQSLERAAQIQTENNKLLVEYYTGLILDKLEAQDSSNSPTSLQEEITSDILAAQEYTDQLFQEMHDVVASSRLDEAGSASLSRELDFFLAQATGGRRGLVVPNASSLGRGSGDKVPLSVADPRAQLQQHAAQLTQRTERLHAVAHGAAAQGLSQKADVERRVHDFVILHEELLRSWNHQLGRFKDRSHFSRRLQQSLMRTINPTLSDLALQTEAQGLEELMLSLDSTWWELRSLFDKGLEAVSDHLSAVEETTSLLKDYTSVCALEYPDLLTSFHSTMRVVDETNAKLAEVWEAAVSLTGLLTSKLVDGGAFDHFARADLLSVDVQQVLTGSAPNRTRALSREQVSLLGRSSLCSQHLSKEAAQAAQNALEDAAFGPSGTGLWMQHVYQVSVVFAELETLEQFHGPLGLGLARQRSDVEDSALRIQESIQASLGRRALLVKDAVDGFQEQHCDAIHHVESSRAKHIFHSGDVSG